MKLNIYSEQKKLIPRKQIGGLIPKFLDPWFKLTRTTYDSGYGKATRGVPIYYKKENINRTVTDGTYNYKTIIKDGALYTYRWKVTPKGSKVINGKLYASPDNLGIAKDLGTVKNYKTPNAVTELRNLDKAVSIKLRQNARRGTYYNKQLQDGRWYYDLGNGRIDVANSDGTSTAYYKSSDGKYHIGTGSALSTTIDSSRNSERTSGKVSGSNKGDSPKTNKPTSENINIPNVSTSNITNDHLTARNNAIQRGWRDYFYNGKRYSLKGSDLKLARKNWNINRGRLSRKTQNSFNPSQVPQESTLNGNALKREIAPIKADSSYGITVSDFKTRYPLIISDEVIKNLRLEPIIQNL